MPKTSVTTVAALAPIVIATDYCQHRHNITGIIVITITDISTLPVVLAVVPNNGLVLVVALLLQLLAVFLLYHESRHHDTQNP